MAPTAPRAAVVQPAHRKYDNPQRGPAIPTIVAVRAPRPTLRQRARRAWDATVEEIRSRMMSTHGVDVSEDQVEIFLMRNQAIENPRSPYFEIDDRSELDSYQMELGSAVDAFLEDYEETQETPTEVYSRYEEEYRKKHGRGIKSTSQISQNATAVIHYSGPLGLEHRALFAQRHYPGMDELAEERSMEITIAPKNLGNIHAEMMALYKMIDTYLEFKLFQSLLKAHPSQPVCFFCEVMLSLFGIAYDLRFVDKKLYPKWIDPTGFFQDHNGTYHTPAALLKLLGMDVGTAAGRLRHLFRDVENPRPFIEKILGGHLQSATQKQQFTKDLLEASPSLRKANERGKGVSGSATRKPTRSTKQGRRLLREQQQKDKQMRLERGKLEKAILSSVQRESILENPGVQLLSEEFVIGEASDDGMNCLIYSVLTAAGRSATREEVDKVRNALIEQGLARRGELLDVQSPAGRRVLEYMARYGSFNLFVVQILPVSGDRHDTPAKIGSGGKPIYILHLGAHFSPLTKRG